MYIKPFQYQANQVCTRCIMDDTVQGITFDKNGECTFCKINDEVEIKQGLLMNFKGIVLEVIGNSAKVKIEGMGITLTAIFDKKNLEKVSTM